MFENLVVSDTKTKPSWKPPMGSSSRCEGTGTGATTSTQAKPVWKPLTSSVGLDICPACGTKVVGTVNNLFFFQLFCASSDLQISRNEYPFIFCATYSRNYQLRGKPTTLSISGAPTVNSRSLPKPPTIPKMNGFTAWTIITDCSLRDAPAARR